MRKRDGFQAININELSLEAQRRKAREEKEAEEKRSQLEKKHRRGRKILKIAMIILPILLAAALVIATIPPFIARREAYSAAGELLKAKKFDEARSAYAALGDYLDSSDLADKGILYEKASFVMACANEKNGAALPYVGLSENDIAQSDDLGMVLFAKAKDLFSELGDYRDSQNKIAEIDSAVARYNDGLILDAYNLAVEKLEKCEYLKARDDFSALGDYRDSEAMKTECIYRRAQAILDFCMNNNARDILVSISNEQNVSTKISMPASALTSLGDIAIGQLESCFSGDGVAFLYEDSPSDAGLLPICDAAAAEFSAMGEYKDSISLAEQAKQAGDFVSEFYSLLREGKLKSAVSWLDTYDDEIPNRSEYYEWLSSYISYCDSWELYKGDSSLIPYSVGVDNKKAVSFTPVISIDGTLVTMTISSEDGAFSVKLTSELGETYFQAQTGEQTFYYAVINQLDHFTYLHYSVDGKVLSSCEYKRAA